MSAVDRDIWREVTERWLYDAEFHARVEMAVNMALAQTRNRSMRTVAREAVALALVLESHAVNIGHAGASSVPTTEVGQ